jgi:3-methyladenine DNA glycosylase AlkD
MLREIYKKDAKTCEAFLRENYAQLPRTTLRYAIERMQEDKRQRYLKGIF